MKYQVRVDELGVRPYFDAEEEGLAAGGGDLLAAFRGRADALSRWHAELARLLADPLLENARRREDPCGPRYDERGDGPYAGAVARFLRHAVADYHRYRHGVERAVTVWAFGRQAPGAYPPAWAICVVVRFSSAHSSRSRSWENRGPKVWVPVVVRVRYGPGGGDRYVDLPYVTTGTAAPRNVLVEREDGTAVVRPARVQRLPQGPNGRWWARRRAAPGRRHDRGALPGWPPRVRHSCDTVLGPSDHPT